MEKFNKQIDRVSNVITSRTTNDFRLKKKSLRFERRRSFIFKKIKNKKPKGIIYLITSFFISVTTIKKRLFF